MVLMMGRREGKESCKGKWLADMNMTDGLRLGKRKPLWNQNNMYMWLAF